MDVLHLSFFLFFSLMALSVGGLIFYLRKKIALQHGIEKEKEELIHQLQIEKQQAQTAAQELAEVKQHHLNSAKLASIGEMAAGVAHEINNPLAVIAGKSSAMIAKMDQGFDPNHETLIETFKKINFCVDRIARIVKSLKTFSRDGSQDPMKIVDVREIIQDTLTLCLERYKNRGIELQVQGLENAIYIHCRPVQISQILVNLLGNAFDAVKDLPTPWVHLIVEKRDSHLEIRVEDSGPGVPEAIQDKIFHPFYTTKELGQGTGLGLSISTSIALHHGGSLILDRMKSPSCFLLKIPCIKDELPEVKQTA